MQFDQLKRRDFVTLLVGAAAGWPLAARAQQPQKMRRIGVLLPTTADDVDYQAYTFTTAASARSRPTIYGPGSTPRANWRSITIGWWAIG
jgi:hypothetical protein